MPKLRPLQQPIYEDFLENEKYETVIYMAGRQSGKSWLAWTSAIILLGMAVRKIDPTPKIQKILNNIESGDPVIYMAAPELSLLIDALQTKGETMIEEEFAELLYGVDITISYSPMKIKAEYTDANGKHRRAHIRFFHLDKRARLKKGRTGIAIFVDEFAKVEEEVMNEVVMPMLSDTEGLMFWLGTPVADPLFRDFMELAKDRPLTKIRTHTILDEVKAGQKSKERLKIIASGYKGGMEHPTFRQEYLADYTVRLQDTILENCEFGVWEGTAEEIDQAEGVRHFISMDIGYQSWYVVMYASVLVDGRVILRYARDWTKIKIDKIIKDVEKDLPKVMATILVPHDGFAKEVVVAQTVAQHWRRSRLSASTAMVAQKNVGDRIIVEESIRILRDHHMKIFIMPELEKNKVMDKAYAAKFDGEKLLKDGVYDHALDALRYLIQDLDARALLKDNTPPPVDPADEYDEWLDRSTGRSL